MIWPYVPKTVEPAVWGLVGCMTWCDRCRQETDHNGRWHQRKADRGR